ncbi:MAG: tRNA glutamyl-Q(34) synthetase GluQRS [Muribaculaceae bacterium]|nr:tRNA glutamyl-Q(34) synthetase GluQRS [Muribaculaceae bacterium]
MFIEASDNGGCAGRFAPSPSGRMHLGNIFTALISWLDARRAGEPWTLRIEDLDPQRSRREYARMIEDDLRWLGLHWDRGGLDDRKGADSFLQSERFHVYEHFLNKLIDTGLVYPCHCSRADIRATQAPHSTDGRVIYAGTCRPAAFPSIPSKEVLEGSTLRLYIPDMDITVTDRLQPAVTVKPALLTGDMVLRRADGAWAYQLAVVVDDALMGVNSVVRGADLLEATASQIYLQHLLGFPTPSYLHVPLLCNSAGQRLSKRDGSLSMEALRMRYSPEKIIGMLGALAGLCDYGSELTASQLLEKYRPEKLRSVSKLTVPDRYI